VSGFVGKQLQPYAPWRSEATAIAVAIQAAVALAIGVYLLFATQHASTTITQIVGGYLAGISVLHLGVAIRRPSDIAARPTALLRRLIGLVAGVIAVLSPWLGFVSSENARAILAGALVLGGLIGTYGAFTDARLAEIRWGSALAASTEIALGVVFYIATDPQRSLLGLLGAILIIAGAVLAARAYWIYQTEAVEQA
jgi:uncharacterized membrane protein HdeD (DUF308 family)